MGDWAKKAYQNTQKQKEATFKTRYKMALKIHAKRMIKKMNAENIDVDKYMFDADKNEWRVATPEELEMIKAYRAEKALKASESTTEA
jgi:hypothetical protein